MGSKNKRQNTEPSVVEVEESVYGYSTVMEEPKTDDKLLEEESKPKYYLEESEESTTDVYPESKSDAEYAELYTKKEEKFDIKASVVDEATNILCIGTKEKLSLNNGIVKPDKVITTSYNFYITILSMLERSKDDKSKFRQILDTVKSNFKKYGNDGLGYKHFIRYDNEYIFKYGANVFVSVKRLIEILDKGSNGKTIKDELWLGLEKDICPELAKEIKDYFTK